MAAEAPDSTFDAKQFDAIYPTGVERHYWNRCRNRVIARELRRIGAQGPMLEIGCGKGLVVAELRKRGFDASGVELAQVQVIPDARDHVRTAIDVIEHLEHPDAFIARIRESFPALQWMVYTVPARQELFSNYDRFNNHYRRYDLGTLRSHVDPDGTRKWKASYFFHMLYPMAWLQLRISGERELRYNVPAPGPASAMHALLGALFFAEHLLFPRNWPGTSIIAAVKER
jgi:SAM-dependent methyltransferase